MQAYKNRSYANRGATFEHLVDMANTKYRNAGVADIRKVPTPVQITKSKGRLIEGRKETAEWVDYAGVYKGRAIAFDAKETSKTSFPLDNLSGHQYRLLESWAEKDAVVFLLVSMKKFGEIYLLPFEVLQKAWEVAKNGGRKSIAWETFKNECIEVTSKDGYTVHYLDALEA
ncbi:Holliday junction resolvase RecU [Lysinibacillus fusiformis]|uniref:Holliday junction resolvase RecU n=1 Tax=Lysinibacillus fusiformis TaxID=28031 RepID=UPI0011BAF419|nr:Holliday junction resolvase RecU [Lysinibacillus fusiformis]QDZ98957.1 Holliday junction resolvase RecU [Lysinibacillus fusiformis]